MKELAGRSWLWRGLVWLTHRVVEGLLLDSGLQEKSLGLETLEGEMLSREPRLAMADLQLESWWDKSQPSAGPSQSFHWLNLL